MSILICFMATHEVFMTYLSQQIYASLINIHQNSSMELEADQRC